MRYVVQAGIPALTAQTTNILLLTIIITIITKNIERNINISDASTTDAGASVLHYGTLITWIIIGYSKQYVTTRPKTQQSAQNRQKNKKITIKKPTQVVINRNSAIKSSTIKRKILF